MNDDERAAFDAVYPTVRHTDSEMHRAYFLAGVDYGRKELVKVAPLPTPADKRWAKPVAELLKASLAVIQESHKQHDEHTPPHKYTAPFGAIAKLSTVLDEHFPESCAKIRARKDA